jgi:hypothetical protein
MQELVAWRGLENPSVVSQQVCSLVALYLSMLTGEDRIIPHDDLLKRLAVADPNVLLPTVRSDGCETDRRRETVFRALATLYYLIVFFRLDVQYSPLRVVMIKYIIFFVCFWRFFF